MSTKGYVVSGITVDGQNKIISALKDYKAAIQAKNWDSQALISETVKGGESTQAFINYVNQNYNAYKQEAYNVIDEAIRKIEGLNSAYQAVDVGASSFLNPNRQVGNKS